MKVSAVLILAFAILFAVISAQMPGESESDRMERRGGGGKGGKGESSPAPGWGPPIGGWGPPPPMMGWAQPPPPRPIVMMLPIAAPAYPQAHGHGHGGYGHGGY